MVAQRFFDELFALPIADQAEVLDRLREHLATEAASADLTDDVRRLLDARLDAFERDETVGSSWEEVSARITARLNAR